MGRGRGGCGNPARSRLRFDGGAGKGRLFDGAGCAGRGVGPGRGLGWFGVGYDGVGTNGVGYDGVGTNGVGYDGVGTNGVANAETEYGIEVKKALEARAAILRAELARTEALLSSATAGTQEGKKEPGEESGG